VLVVTNAAYAADLQKHCPQLPPENFVIEPAPRNTAPAIALAALAVRQRDPHGLMACLTADHFIGDEARFRAVLSAAARAAEQGFLVTLGIAPSFASTGYGYIQRGPSLGAHAGFEVYRAARFREKPDRATAEAMLADGLHSWNSGMFIWRVDRILAEFARQLPDFYKMLLAMEADPTQLPALWPQAPNTSIDYGIMEGAEEVAVIPADGLGWSDIGSWDALLDVLPPDANGNVVVGPEHLGVGSRGTLIHAGSGPHKLIATIGVENLVIVDTGDVLLVCPREKAQDVRAVVDTLKKREDGKQYL
jgi:mannose-1-phosphate guanylyltransferase